MPKSEQSRLIAKATGRCKFTVGRIVNPSYNHIVLGIFPSAGRLNGWPVYFYAVEPYL